MASHIIKNLNKPNKSKKRSSPFLPVRYSPSENNPKLELGWDDENFLLINNEGKLVNPEKEDCDGIELPPEVEVEVIEIVNSLTGIWYGFVFTSNDVPTEKINSWTADETKVLYARPHYFEKTDSAPDILISNNLTKKEASDAESGLLEGAKLIAPDSNLNWKKLEKYDVRLAYYNFNKHNRKNIPEDLLIIDASTIEQNPTFRYSEGLYYFIAEDGKRKTAEELGVEGDAEESQETAKSEEAAVSAGSIKTEAFETLLRYLNKDISSSNHNVLIRTLLKNRYFVNVSEHVTTNSSNPKNQKILFAISANYIDGLPSSDLKYGSEFDPNHEDDAPFAKGRDYAFFIKLKDLRGQVDDLVESFEQIKSKVEEFRQSGGKIKNPNNIDFDVEQQIEALKEFPDIIDEFLERQADALVTNSDVISRAAAQGTNTDDDHIIQIGLKDNNVIGGNVRETISYILFSPDNKYLSNIDNISLYELDPWLTKEEASGAKESKRSGIDLRNGLNWLRSKFIGTQGTRTLHYLMAQKSIIGFNELASSDVKLNEWMKFLQNFSAPPFLIQLTRDKRREEEAGDYDCVELIEGFLEREKSGEPLTAKENNEQQKILKNPKCAEAWRKAKQKDTSSADSSLSKKGLLGTSKVVKGVSKSAGEQNLKLLYTGLLHNLDPQALLSLLMACIQSRLGIPLTAEALCEAAITKLIEDAGIQEFTNTIIEAFPELEVELGEAIVELKLTNTTVNEDGERADINFDGAPIAAALFSRDDDLDAANSVREMEQSGVSIDLTPGTFTDAATGGSKPYAEIDINAATRNFLELGFTEEETNALLVKDGYLEPSQVQYQSNSDNRIFSETEDSYDNSPYGKVQNAGKFVQYLKSRIGLHALCEGIVGPLLEMPGGFLSDPGGFIKQLRPPSLSIPKIALPDSLATEDMIGDFGDQLLSALLGMIASMLGQILGLLLEELISACFEEDTDLGRTGNSNNLTSVPIPFDELQNALGSIGTVGDLPLSDVGDWAKDILSNNNLSPSQICALLKGNASNSTLKDCLEATKLNNPEMYENGIESSAEIRTLFRTIGEHINLDICDAIGTTLPSVADACGVSYNYDARCAELQMAGLTKEECDKQIKKELEDLKNKILALSGWLFPNSNPLDGILSDKCGPQGLFILPPAIKDSMAWLTDEILTYIKYSLLEDLQSLKFFSLPPRAVMAAADPGEMEAAAQAITDQVQEEPYHALALAYIGGGDQDGSGGYKTAENDYHMCYSATRHYLPREADLKEEFESFSVGNANGPKGKPDLRDHRMFEPLVFNDFDPGSGFQFKELMNNFFPNDVKVEIRKIAVDLGLSDFEKDTTDLTVLGNDTETLYNTWQEWKRATELLEQQMQAFIDNDQTLLDQIAEELDTVGEVVLVAAQAILAYFYPAPLLGLIADFWAVIEGGWNDFRAEVDPAFKRRQQAREKNERIRIAEEEMVPRISEMQALTTVTRIDYENSDAQLDIAEADYETLVNQIGAEIKVRVNKMPMPMNIEKLFFTANLFLLWTGSNRGFLLDEEHQVASERYGGYAPFGIDYSVLWPDPSPGDAGAESNMNLAATRPFSHIPDAHGDMVIYYPLDRKLRDIHELRPTWRHMLRMFTGVKEPTTVFNCTGEDAVCSWNVKPGSLSTNLSPGINYLANLADADSQVIPNDIIEAFMNLTFGEATGLTRRRLRAMYPKFASSDAIEGVICQKSTYKFKELTNVYLDVTILDEELAVSIIAEDLDSWVAPGYEDWSLALLVFMQALGWSDKKIARNNVLPTVKLGTWPLALMDILVDAGAIRYETRTTSVEFDDDLGNFLGYAPVFAVFKKYVRDPDNPWEQDAKGLAHATSLEGRKVNIELYDSLVDSSIFPELFDRKISSNIAGSIETTAIMMAPGGTYSNFNPNYLKYDLPFTEIISSDQNARRQVEEVLNLFKNSSSQAIATALDGIQSVSLNNILLYQNMLAPLENTNEIQKNGLKDVSKLIKGKISPDHPPTYNGAIESDSWVSDGIYNFNFQTGYAPDIQNLLSDIGLNSSNDISDLLSANKIVNTVEHNSKAVIFGRLLTHKLKKLLEKYPNEEDTTSSDVTKEEVLRHVSRNLSDTGYASLQFAYSNQMFVKLKNSRLHYRKFLRKLWKKILKSPLVSQDLNSKCQQTFNYITSPDKKTETDFFDLEKVKPKIMDFYENSVCRDVYDKAPEGHNAVKDSLIGGCILLLIKVYTLEMCLASVISWDSFDIGDIFKDRAMVKVVVANIKQDITNFEKFTEYSNDIVKKLENLEDYESYMLASQASSIEYLIKKESEDISATIKSLFLNSSPLSTDLDLDITLSSDEKEHWDSDEKILYKFMKEAGHEYVVDAKFTNNIYTMNYGWDMNLVPGRFTSPQKMENDIYTGLWVANSGIDLFGMSKSDVQQKLHLHSLPMTFHENGELHAVTWPNKWEIYDPYNPNVPTKEYIDYASDYYNSAERINEVSKHNQNCYEMLFTNEINSKLGNITFQPYVKIVDTQTSDLEGLVAKDYIFAETPSGEPCEDTPQATSHTMLKDLPLPFLGYYRNENNVFGCKIYDYVPLDVWSYFYTHVFLKKIMDVPEYKMIYEQYGIKPFFKEIKFGIRMVYSRKDYSIDIGDKIKELVGSNNLKKAKAIYNFRREVSTTQTKTYKTHPSTTASPGPDVVQAVVTDGEVVYLNPDVNLSSVWGAAAGGPEAKLWYVKQLEELSKSHEGQNWPSIVKETTDAINLAPELQIPIVEVERHLDFHHNPHGFSIGGFSGVSQNRPGNFFSYDELGYLASDPMYIGSNTSVSDLQSDAYADTIKGVINNPAQFFYKRIAKDLLAELKQTPEFRLMFEHLFPMHRYMSLAFLYSGDGLSKFIPEPTDVLDETKEAILTTIQSLFESDNFVYDSTVGESMLEASLMRGSLGTRGNSPDTTKMLLKIIFMTPLLILKGLVELIDPAISISKKIIDLAATIAATIISGIEQGIRAAITVAEQDKISAEFAVSQAEVNAQIASDPAKIQWKLISPTDRAAAYGNTTLNLDGPIKGWEFPNDASVEVDPETGEQIAQQQGDVEISQDFLNALADVQDKYSEWQDAGLEVRSVDILLNGDPNDPKSIGLKGDLNETLKQAKEITDAAFSSPYALPSLWASLVPSTIPFFGGLSPMGGPPSTIPGMIYLALLFLDMYEEKQHDDGQLSEEEDCDEQL